MRLKMEEVLPDKNDTHIKILDFNEMKTDVHTEEDFSECKIPEERSGVASQNPEPKKEELEHPTSYTTALDTSKTPVSTTKRGIKRKKRFKRTRLTCGVCKRQFRDNFNLKRHYETKHGEVYTCKLCSAVYNTEKKLNTHMKKHEALGSNSVRCLTCSRLFRDNHNMRLHKCSRMNKRTKCIFSECGQMFYHVTKMLKHVETVHEGKIETVNLTFDSESQFQCWKEEEELKSFSYFSKRNGTVDLDLGTYRYYICQANGKNIEGTRKTSKKWKKGQVRLGKLCPSRMLVKEVDGRIFVKYISLHSHDRLPNNEKLPVPKSVQTFAKNLLMMGASPQQVRKSVCEGQYGGSGVIPQGGYVISNRYFFDLKKRLEAKHNITIDEDKDNYDPVFVYKPHSEPVVVGSEELDHLPHANDLFAIGLQTKEQCVMMKKRGHKVLCVMSLETHSLYGFEILTLVVPDVFGNGYPVAHILTNHMDEATLSVLFSCLRKRCPCVKIRYVMTDDKVSVFNAINFAFGNVKHFLCHWYIKTNWEIKIRTMCASDKGDLQTSLRAILMEKNRSSFKALCGNFVEKFSQHYPDFVKYFIANYLSRVDLWAMYCRHCSVDAAYPWPYTNISLHCEYFHNKMKEFIADGIESRRVADVALLLLKIQEGHHQHYDDQKAKGTRVRSAASGKHHNGMLINDDAVSFTGGLWYVKSRLDNAVKYMVSKKNDSCEDPSCYDICSEGSCDGLCSHLYRCTCLDRADLCEHIHKVHSWRSQQMTVFKGTAKKKCPQHVEVTYSEAPQNMDEQKFNYITVIKKEMDDFNESDVDFVHIDIDEIDESGFVYEEQYPLQNQVEDISTPECSPKKRSHKQRNFSYSSDYTRRITSDTIQSSVSKSWHQNGTVSDPPLTINTDFIKTENVHSNELATEPMINFVEIHNEEGAAMDIPGEKILILKCDPEGDGLLSPEHEKDTPLQRSRSQSNLAWERASGKRVEKVVLGSLADLKVSKSVTARTPRKAVKKVTKPKAGRDTTSGTVSVGDSVQDIDIKCEYLSEYNDLLSKLAEVEDRQCKYCSRVCRDKYNLKKHIQRLHLKCKYCDQVFADEQSLDVHFQEQPTHNSQYVCKVCYATFESYLRLKRHKKKHNAKMSVQCAVCNRIFRDRYNLKLHQCGKGKVRNVCIYPECEVEFYRMSEMIRHIEEVHEDRISSQTLHFESEKLFKAWKEEEETRTNAIFTKRSGSHPNRAGDTNSEYYICQASGPSRKKNNPSRVGRSSRRSDKLCPSRMVVRENQGKYSVFYIESHSHDVANEKRPLPLPASVKELGKQLLLMGVHPKRVRESIQEGVLINDHLGTYKSYTVPDRYFYDMKTRLQLRGCIIPDEKEQTRTGKHLNNFLEVLLKGNFKGYNPVLVYKPQGQSVIKGEADLDGLPFSNFLFAFGMQTKHQNEMMKEGCCKVVCIRSYFDVDTDGFQLYNMVVPDKFGNGFPVAHFITNHVDKDTLRLLFTSLKKRCPTIKIPALITDDDLVLYEAIKSEFGDVNHYLCHSYIKKCWFQQVDKLIDKPAVRADIKSDLSAILYEREEGRFQVMCRELITKYKNQYERFCDYFTDCYMGRREVWAMYCRLRIDGLFYSEIFSNISLHCEYLHNRLASLSVSGPFCERMVRLTDLLIKAEKEYNLLYRKRTHTSIPVNNSMYGRHRSGLEIYDNTVSQEKDVWRVASRFNKKKIYEVTLIEASCDRGHCYEKCTEFLCLDLCSHMYACTCEDRAELCEHIHKIHSLRLRSEKCDIPVILQDADSTILLFASEDATKEPTVKNVAEGGLSENELESEKVITHEIFET